MSPSPFQPFQLPNGSKLKNRIAKAALQEKMADVDNHNQPTEAMIQLYRMWGQGGAGLILSGHIMIDPLIMASPADILLAEDTGKFDDKLWRRWIDATQENGAQFWLQLNHPGRQVRKGAGFPVYAPSEVNMEMGSLSNMWVPPKALTEDQILRIIHRFVWAAHKAEELGTSGVEIHAGHGYLISQFLSHRTNHRTDQWGGSLENRARFLYEIVRAIRANVSARFGVGVKLNSADFQSGGFGPEEFIEVVQQLSSMPIDFLEVSGGNYEIPVMLTGHKPGGDVTSTAKCEAYFLEAAESITAIGTMPIMVTGGISKLATLNAVVETSDRFIAGVGTAIGLIPDIPSRWERGEDPAPATASSWILSGLLLAGAKTAAVEYNMHRHGAGSKTWVGVWPVFAFLVSAIGENPKYKGYVRWVTQQQMAMKH